MLNSVVCLFILFAVPLDSNNWYQSYVGAQLSAGRVVNCCKAWRYSARAWRFIAWCVENLWLAAGEQQCNTCAENFREPLPVLESDIADCCAF